MFLGRYSKQCPSGIHNTSSLAFPERPSNTLHMPWQIKLLAALFNVDFDTLVFIVFIIVVFAFITATVVIVFFIFVFVACNEAIQSSTIFAPISS